MLGPRQVKLPSVSDPVLIRADGTPLYTFTSVVDDIETGITHVIRGEDHVTNTGRAARSCSRRSAAIRRGPRSRICRC